MKQLDSEKAVVLLSGGQDSVTCLYWSLKRFKQVWALSIDYGQRHKVELACAQEIAQLAGVSHRLLNMSLLSELGGNTLTEEGEIEEGDPDKGGLPNTFVPGRNLMFLTALAAWAYQLGAKNLVTGVCQTDFSGYPDCRENTMISLQESLRLGMEADFEILTPLMHLTKAESVHLAKQCDAMDALSLSHTCYEGQQPPCGRCPSCDLRAKGFAQAGIEDPLILRWKS